MCPNAKTNEYINVGYCFNCGAEISNEYTYWIDKDFNTFCSRDCVDEYYGLKEIDDD